MASFEFGRQLVAADAVEWVQMVEMAIDMI